MLYLHNKLVVEHRRTVVDLDRSMHSELLQLLLHLKYIYILLSYLYAASGM